MLKVLRYILLGIMFILVGTFGSLFCMFRPFQPKNTPLFAHIVSYLGLKILNLKVTFKNWEKRIPLKPSIVICNHQSILDIFLCGAVIHGRTVSVGKKALKYIPFFGQLYWLAGNILIERESPKKAMVIMDRATQKAVIEDNMSIWVFPEGTRNPKPVLLPFKRGAFRTAIKAQVPLLPICVSTYQGQVDLNRWQSGHIMIDILDTVFTGGLKPSDSAELAKRCQNQIQERINTMNEALSKLK
jgi:1-acyl-sn-glycerol-3-phosphate acyltransferase